MNKIQIEFDPLDDIIIMLSECKTFLNENIKDELQKLSKTEFQSLLNRLADEYYNETNPLVTDDVYDQIEQIFKNKHQENTNIRTAVSSRVKKIELPFPMFSLDKVKEEKQLNNWKNKWSGSNVYIDDKLDGISACYYSKDGKYFLFKHGDQFTGTDVSYLLNYIKLPKIKDEFAARGEIVISLDTFNKKYSEIFKNPRNMVSGLTNAATKNPDGDKIKDLEFIPYQIYTEQTLSKQDQMNRLKQLGFIVNEGMEMKFDEINIDNLTKITKNRKKNGKYYIDGMVLTVNKPGLKFPTDSNPKHQIAFKIKAETAETIVNYIEWNVRKLGNYKPRVNIKPVNLSGARLEWITGNNSRYIVDNGIGPGAKVLVARTNEVKPQIIEVLEKVEPQLPEDPEAKWNENNVELIAGTNDQNKDQQNIAKIVGFFDELGAKFLAEKTVSKIYYAGFNTIKDFITLDEEDILTIEGYKDKMAEKIVDSIRGSIDNVHIYNVMAASCFFPNFGSKRLKLITDEIPDLQYITDEEELDEIKEKILKIKGFKKLADVFVENLIPFNKWLEEHKEINIIKQKRKLKSPPKTTGKLSGQTIVFSGVRDALLQREIEKHGGRVTSAVSKQTTIVLTKDSEFTSLKIEKAKENGAEVMDLDAFKDMYMLF